MKSFATKFLFLAVITFGLLLGLMMVDGLVSERQRFREQAIREVSDGLSGPQSLGGPYIVIPYTEEWEAPKYNEKGEFQRMESKKESYGLWVLPEKLEIKSQLVPDIRQRGIFSINGYQVTTSLRGHFVLPAQAPKPVNHDKASIRQLDGAAIGVAMTETRGIRSFNLSLNGEALSFEPKIRAKTSNVVEAKLSKISWDGAKLDFEAELQLGGAQSFDILPVGKESNASMTSSWPHPSFGGVFLPNQREVGSAGFTASWKVSHLANPIRERWLTGGMAGLGEQDRHNAMTVRIIDPVNHYTMTDRSIKYGLLFILSTLVGFFLFELLKQKRVHPMQYSMIGAALVMFFMLLLSLSERIGFDLAYLCAALACTALITYYSRFVLHTWQAAAVIALQLILSFAAIFGLLKSEQNALLIGSVLIFATLASVMIATRRINWFEKIAEKRPANLVGTE